MPIRVPLAKNIAKERKRRGAFGGTYQDQLAAMIEAEKVLTAKRRDEKTLRWNELKMLEDEK